MARNAGSDLEVEGTLRVVGECESRAELRDMKPSCDMLNCWRSCCVRLGEQRGRVRIGER